MTVKWLYGTSLVALIACLTACAPAARDADSQTRAHRVVVRHPGFADDKPREYALIQVNDAAGFPAEYRMTVDSVICPEQTCQIISVDMTWDALGFFKSYELPEGDLLEKGVAATTEAASGALPFTAADYRKLNAILNDADSLLGKQRLPDVVRLSISGDVDCITGATPDSVKDAVVEGASLTCYHLWHWANGDVAAIAKELTHSQCDEAMLLHYLLSGEPHYKLFALEHLKTHGLFGPAAVKAVSDILRAGVREQIEPGLAYLRQALPDSDAFHAHIAAVILSGNDIARAYLLDCLAPQAKLPDKFFETLAADITNWNNYYELHLFLRMAEKNGYAPASLITQVSGILANPNFLIARRAYWFLEKQADLDESTTAILKTFKERAAREGRTL